MIGAQASIQTLARQGLDILLPPRCYACGAGVSRQGELCGPCWRELTFITAPACARCGYPFDYPVAGEGLCAACQARSPAYDRAASALVYDEASRGLVLAFKRGDRTELAPPLARMMARAGRELIGEADRLIPVPLHRRRLFARRFNQAGLLAKALAGETGLAWEPTRLRRRRATMSQGGLTLRQRKANLRGAFTVAGRLEGARVLLIDDVMTTGATLEACARILRRAGAERVDALTLARVVTPGQSPI